MLASSYCEMQKLASRLTTMIFTKPRAKTTIPDAITERQMLVPRASLLAEGLLRFLRMFAPIPSIARPSVTKPWIGLRRGQCVRKYLRKRGISEMIRNTGGDVSMRYVLQLMSRTYRR